MAVKKLSDKELKAYHGMLVELGEEDFYAKLIAQGVKRFANKVVYPEVDLLDISEAFFIANRRDEDEIVFSIGKIFRRAAHKLHRELSKIREVNHNPRFISAIK